MNFKKTTIFVILSSILIAIIFAVAVWDINFVPTDAKHLYFKAANKLHDLDYVSQIHTSIEAHRIHWLHGKEGFVLFSAWMQNFLNDYTTLRPFILLDIISHSLSAILIFFIARYYFGALSALVCYLIFVTSFWPYMYVLFVKHQPFGLTSFLLSIWMLHQIHGKRFVVRKLLYFLAAGLFCFSVFSSTVSVLYFPFYVVVFYLTCVHGREGEGVKSILGSIIGNGVLSLMGVTIVFVYFNYPNVAQNVREYLEYIQMSSSSNHFKYNRPILVQWIPEGVTPHGGWLWVFRYFKSALPVLLPVYFGCLVYVVTRIRKAGVLLTLMIVALSVVAPVLAEIKGVAQYGANYFPAFIGIILVVGYAISVARKDVIFTKMSPRVHKVICAILILIGCAHVAKNAYDFFSDVYPSRMATTYASRKIKELGVDRIYTYKEHPLRTFLVDTLNPDVMKNVEIISMNNIYHPKEGFILLPPVTMDYLYEAITSYVDYIKDIYVNELVQKGNLQDYAVGSFKTIASSRLWSYEEETMSYRYLILKQFPGMESRLRKGKLLLLDAAKLQKDIMKNIPRKKYREMVFKGLRNIGTKNQIYSYNGGLIWPKVDKSVNSLSIRLYKVGQPTDSLVTYVYKRDEKDGGLWLPSGKYFMSEPVEAKDITDDPNGQSVRFYFPKPLILKKGTHLAVTYRLGKSSDKDFYCVYTENAKDIASAIKRTWIPKTIILP